MDRAARQIIRQLGQSGRLDWKDPKGKNASIVLDDKVKRLLAILANAVEQRESTGEIAATRGRLDDELFAAVEAAWTDNSVSDGKDDSVELSGRDRDAFDSWILHKIEAIGFGGLGGARSTKPFVAEFAPTSTCVYGGNGSGKTSLISAISWALTGQRLSDVTGLSEGANTPQPIFSSTDPSNQIGTWPPIATYPSPSEVSTARPITSVSLTFRKGNSEEEASVTRTWNADATGYTIEQWDEKLTSLRDYLDVAVEMPLRISHLRLGENGRLNDAVASLTGLDVITGLGQLAAWLGRKNAPFRSNPKQTDHDAAARLITGHFEKASQLAPTTAVELEPYRALTNWLSRAKEHEDGLGTIANKLTSAAALDLQSLKTFVADSIGLDTSDGQKIIATAVAAAVNTYTSDHLKNSFVEKCPLLSKFGSISQNAEDIEKAITDAISHAEGRLQEVVRTHRLRINDRKLSLKAVAAETHQMEHGDTPISECILCERAFDTDKLLALGSEIGRLAADAKLLLEPLEAACNGIVSTLANAVSTATSLPFAEISSLEPARALRGELHTFLIRSHSFSAQLPIFGRLFDATFPDEKLDPITATAPSISEPAGDISDLPVADRTILKRVQTAIANATQAVAIAKWAKANLDSVRSSYRSLLGASAQDAPADNKTIRGMCKTLSRAITDAKPAQQAGEEVRSAARSAISWLGNEKRRQLRETIVSSLEPLEKLPKFVEAEVGRQIGDLSTQIAKIVHRFHIAAPLEFQRARYERMPRQRAGLLRARATPKAFSGEAADNDNTDGYEVDASLIANTSWTRALLWAFIFALRMERAKHAQKLPMPLMLMDDPQTTFDLEHRCAWIDYILSAQAEDRISPPSQTILTSHDQAFVQQVHLQAPECEVRHITAPSSEYESAFIDGTTAVDILWGRAEHSKKNADASRAISALRTYLEGMTRAIFPRALGATSTTLGQLMDELAGKVGSNDFPYSSVEFANLIKAWKEPSKQPQRDALSDVHHTNEPLYDYTFGKNLFGWFNKALKGRFQKAFDRIRLLREAGWRTPHSGVSIVSRVADDSIIGKSMPLPANLNRLIGKVAAESEGREIEGQPSLRFVTNDEELPELESFEALVLTAATLEPAAQIGDILLLSPTLPPTENSLVVCHANGAWRARRYGELGASSQHAVLVASSVNPRQIRHPILVDKLPSNFRKVVGIVYRERWEPPPATEDEAADLINISALEGLLSRSIGRIQVIGDSAEPIALQGQYLMSAPHVPTFSELLEHDGRPVVADLDGRVVFKRLRLTKRGGPIVLESMDAAGRHPPMIVSPEEARALGDKLKFWPVIGVLFDTSSMARQRK